MSLNKVMLIGNVGKNPEVRYLENNAKVASFSLATSEKYRDREGRVKEITEWHSIVTWRSMADVVEKYVRKGTLLYVEGRLRTRSWNDRSGNTRYETEIMADNMQLLGRAPEQQDGNIRQEQDGYTRQPVKEKPEIQTDAADDGLPF